MVNSKIFSNDKFIGYLSKITQGSCVVQIPDSVLIKPFWNNGEEYVAGIVGNYVVIEGLNNGFLGKIREVGIPEDEIKKLDNFCFDMKLSAFKNNYHPYAIIDLLNCFDLYEMKIKNGIRTLPLIASKVYLCSQKFLQNMISNRKDTSTFDIATLNNVGDVNVDRGDLFGRHCAIIGNTGGGKSWTVARFVEQCKNKGKIILIDATGEYALFANESSTMPIYFGKKLEHPQNYQYVNYNYQQLTISDLQLMLRPSPQSQMPKLLEAIKSLKVLKLLNDKEEVVDFKKTYEAQNGTIKKAGKSKELFNKVCNEFVRNLNCDDNNYDIWYLGKQIQEECIWDTDKSDNLKWGCSNQQELGYQITLISRIYSLLNNETLNDIFDFNCLQKNNGVENEIDPKSFKNVLDEFLRSDDKNLLLVNLSKVGFDFNAREILVNVIGKELLKKAREEELKNNPIIVFLDEAHQFLNKKIQDSYNGDVELNAFDLIAKECRKYGLYLCIATQMPRDIPTGTLSQIGTFVIHRLINDLDIDKIKGSCSEINRNILGSLANLSSGEAIISSVNLAFPLVVKIKEPKIKPISNAPINLLD